ncbi:MAG: helix-turn-helix domain-containing protein [Sporichthyaceae bacterium]
MSPDLMRTILDRSGLSMTELAARAGVSRASVSEYLHGHRNPSLHQLERIAAAADLDLQVAVEPGWRERRKREFEDVLELADRLPFRPNRNEGPPTWAELVGQ